MDLTHLHLLITHLPIYGSILGAFVLVYGMYTKSRQTRMAGYFVLLLSSAGGLIAYSTGESAEETAENIQGVSKNLIEEHEDFAKGALYAIIVQGLLSIAGLVATWKNSKFSGAMAYIVLFVSLVCFGMAAWTGYLGGQIRHTEVSKGTAQMQDKKDAKFVVSRRR